jgi:protein SCO1/2
MRLFLIFFFIFFFPLCSSVFSAEALPVELKGVGISERLGEQIDLNLTFRDEKGELVSLKSVVNGRKPVLLFLAYYTCPNLCNLFLNGATDVLKKLQWTIGKEFQILTVSIDPRETPELAAKKKQSHLTAYARTSQDGAAESPQFGWHFWVNDETLKDISEDVNQDHSHSRVLANQVGFGYKFDKAQAQFAHTAAMIVLTPEGKISRYLYGIDFQPKDVKFALVEAGGRKIGSVMDHLLLFCYNYDPKTKKYSLYATNLMRVGGGFTVLIVGSILAGVWRRNRKNSLRSEKEVLSSLK